MSPLVGFGVSKPVKEAAQEGIGVEVATRCGFAGLCGRSGDVLGRPDQEFCDGRQSSGQVLHIVMTCSRIGRHDIHCMSLY